MRQRLSRLDTGSLVLIVLTTATGVVLWPQLPPRVAIHFSVDGTPGNDVSRTIAVVGMPVAMVVTGAVLKTAGWVDPPEDPRTLDAIVWSTMALFAVVQLFTLGTALNGSNLRTSFHQGLVLDRWEILPRNSLPRERESQHSQLHNLAGWF